MRSSRRLRGWLRAAVLTTLAATASAQEARQEPAPPVFEGQASVLVVELPVRVVRHGRPVRGLTAESFEVYDAGVRRPLLGFEVIDLARPSPDKDATALPRPPTASRHFLLLFDLAYASSSSLSKALRASWELVEEKLNSGDRVAVAFFSALRGFRLLTDFTDDPGRIRLGLYGMSALLARETEAAGEIFDLLYPSVPGGDAPLVSRKELVAEAGILVRADPFWPHRAVIADLAQALAKIPEWAGQPVGLRSIIFFSHGFDSRLLTGSGSASTLGELERAFRGLRTGGWAIQAINAGGLRAPNGRESLFYLAHETGGESYENFNDMDEAMGLLLRKSQVTYLLAFSADDIPRNGRFRRLRVRLVNVQPGARVVHRPGYYALPPPAADPPVGPRADASSRSPDARWTALVQGYAPSSAPQPSLEPMRSLRALDSLGACR